MSVSEYILYAAFSRSHHVANKMLPFIQLSAIFSLIYFFRKRHRHSTHDLALSISMQVKSY